MGENLHIDIGSSILLFLLHEVQLLTGSWVKFQCHSRPVGWQRQYWGRQIWRREKNITCLDILKKKGRLIERITEKKRKKKLKSKTTNKRLHRHWCINTFIVTYFYICYFLFHKCANRHTLLLCQINLTWLCLHQSAGFLRRHCLHPKCVHVSYGNRKTHASCHGGYLLSICLLRRIAVYQTAQQPESLTQYFQWHIKMSKWKRKDKSCTLLDLEESMG